MTDAPAIAWLRRDLRLADNPALAAAAAAGGPTIVVFILDDAAADAPGGAARWWLDRSLRALRRALGKRGGALVLRRGDTTEELLRLVDETGAQGVFCNRRYDPHGVAVDTALKETLKARGVAVESANGNLLREPWELKTGGGTFYKVFTPMWRALQKAGPAREAPVPAPKKLAAPATLPASDALENWGLAPEDPNWAEEFETIWTPGEKGAHDRLDGFLAQAVSGYGDNRNRPDCESTSRLSPHLAWGEISPLTIWTTTRDAIAAGGAPEADASTFLSEIAWREFSYTLLFHLPDLKAAPLRPEFEAFPWRDDAPSLRAWRRGRTGYPIVDAGMRQLWRTGWMHNRVRMIVASFLVKHLLTPWQAGEAWFWDTLVDADPANNPASWQWTAGSGADAAPYFRIFNPITQGEKFDPDGVYTRAFVPELKDLPKKYLQKPWEAPAAVLRDAGVVLGETYPEPIVDHASARRRALDAFETAKKKG